MCLSTRYLFSSRNAICVFSSVRSPQPEYFRCDARGLRNVGVREGLAWVGVRVIGVVPEFEVGQHRWGEISYVFELTNIFARVFGVAFISDPSKLSSSSTNRVAANHMFLETYVRHVSQVWFGRYDASREVSFLPLKCLLHSRNSLCFCCNHVLETCTEYTEVANITARSLIGYPPHPSLGACLQELVIIETHTWRT